LERLTSLPIDNNCLSRVSSLCALLKMVKANPKPIVKIIKINNRKKQLYR